MKREKEKQKKKTSLLKAQFLDEMWKKFEEKRIAIYKHW